MPKREYYDIEELPKREHPTWGPITKIIQGLLAGYQAYQATKAAQTQQEQEAILNALERRLRELQIGEKELALRERQEELEAPKKPVPEYLQRILGIPTKKEIEVEEPTPEFEEIMKLPLEERPAIPPEKRTRKVKREITEMEYPRTMADIPYFIKAKELGTKEVGTLLKGQPVPESGKRLTELAKSLGIDRTYPDVPKEDEQILLRGLIQEKTIIERGKQAKEALLTRLGIKEGSEDEKILDRATKFVMERNKQLYTHPTELIFYSMQTGQPLPQLPPLPTVLEQLKEIEDVFYYMKGMSKKISEKPKSGPKQSIKSKYSYILK
jgi:hypothetical protein